MMMAEIGLLIAIPWWCLLPPTAATRPNATITRNAVAGGTQPATTRDARDRGGRRARRDDEC